MITAGNGLAILLFEPLPDRNGFADPSLNARPTVACFPGNPRNAEPLFILGQNIHQHTQRDADNRQKSMGQDREGFSGASVIITPVSLDIFQLIIEQVSAVIAPFCIAVTVSAVGALDDGSAVFSCDF
jgi:hypothetical protein